MDDREKLVQLLKKCNCPEDVDRCCDCGYYNEGSLTIKCDSYRCMADYLTSNGVTFAKDTNVPSKTDAIMEEMYDFYQKTVAHAGPSKVDYIDGVYALMDHMARWFEEKESE